MVIACGAKRSAFLSCARARARATVAKLACIAAVSRAISVKRSARFAPTLIIAHVARAGAASKQFGREMGALAFSALKLALAWTHRQHWSRSRVNSSPAGDLGALAFSALKVCSGIASSPA